MSVADTEIWCESCGFRSGSGRIWGFFIYIYRYGSPDSHETYVNRVAGWCQRCANIEAIEDLTASVRLAEDLGRKIANLQRISRSLLYRLFGFGESHLNEIRAGIHRDEKELRLLAVLFHRRTAPPRCLKCGSVEVRPIYLPDPREGEVLELNTRHPGCGGRLLAMKSSIRLNVRLLRRIYDEEGNFLGEEEPVE